MGDDELSRVVFLNEFEEAASAEEVRDALAQWFNPGAAALDRLFASPPVVVKSNVDAETALRSRQAIETARAKYRIEAMPDGDDTDERGYIDRRVGERRRQGDRRGRTRAETLSPDRRKCERRGGGEGGGFGLSD